jgi:hypothetical protein
MWSGTIGWLLLKIYEYLKGVYACSRWILIEDAMMNRKEEDLLNDTRLDFDRYFQCISLRRRA